MRTTACVRSRTKTRKLVFCAFDTKEHFERKNENLTCKITSQKRWLFPRTAVPFCAGRCVIHRLSTFCLTLLSLWTSMHTANSNGIYLTHTNGGAYSQSSPKTGFTKNRSHKHVLCIFGLPLRFNWIAWRCRYQYYCSSECSWRRHWWSKRLGQSLSHWQLLTGVRGTSTFARSAIHI